MAPRDADVEELHYESPDTSDVVVTFSLSGSELHSLRALAQRSGTTVTEQLRRAIALHRFISELPEGSRLHIHSADGVQKEIVFRA